MPRAATAYPWLAAVGLTLAVLLAIDPSGASAQEQAPSAPEAVGGVSGGEGGSVGGGDDEQGPPAAPRSAEREAREDRQDQSAAEHKGFGQSRRADPFEFGEAAPSAMTVRGPVAAAGSAQDVIICMAGCDGAPGEIVARARKGGAGSVE